MFSTLRNPPRPSNLVLSRTTHPSRIYNFDEPVQIPPEMKIQMPKDRTIEYDRWITELNACITYLQDETFTYVDKTNEIQQLTNYWLSNYYDLNLEQDGLSRTDILFYIRCFLIVCNRDTSTIIPYNIDDLSIIYNRIAILSCNHNCNAKESYPSDNEIAELELDISCFIVWHYYSQKKFKTYVDQFMDHFKKQIEEKQDMKTNDLFKPLPDDLQKKTKMLVVENELESNANKGWLWSQTANEMLCNLIPLCSRVFSEIIRTRQLKQLYPIKNMTNITPQSIIRLADWTIKQCSIEVEDDFNSIFTDLAHELQLPMGSRLQSQRKTTTRDDKDMPIRILERELGYDTVSRLGSIANTKPIDIANNPNHDNYDALIFAVFDMRLTQTKKTSLIKEYIIPPTQYSNQQLKRGIETHKLFSTTEFHSQRRYPLITLLQRKWTIHYRSTWFICDSASEALLGWILIIQQEFKGNLPGVQINITNDYYNLFFQ